MTDSYLSQLGMQQQSLGALGGMQNTIANNSFTNTLNWGTLGTVGYAPTSITVTASGTVEASPQPDDEKAWLRKRIREIEWRP